jgi:hypothetical protein
MRLVAGQHGGVLPVSPRAPLDVSWPRSPPAEPLPEEDWLAKATEG